MISAKKFLGLLVFQLIFILFSAEPARMQEAVDGRIKPMDVALRIHAQPASISDVVAVVDPGAPISIIGRTHDKAWLQIRSPEDAEGWIIAEFAEIFIDLEGVAITTDLGALGHEVTLDPLVVKRIRKIFLAGQEKGNRPNVFSKVGDSITAAPHMLNPIGEGLYNLADYQYLQGVVDYFSAVEVGSGNSFNHVSLAANIGWPAPAVLDAKFADPALCLSDETPLACEYRVMRPAVALIMFGTNDLARFSASVYRGNLQEIVQTSITMGVIPVISTIPKRADFEEQVAAFNAVVVETAARFSIPLWDYNVAMQDLPNNGLDVDGVHPSIPPRGYKGSADFRAHNLYYGYVVRNLTALQMLDAVWQAVADIPPMRG